MAKEVIYSVLASPEGFMDESHFYDSHRSNLLSSSAIQCHVRSEPGQKEPVSGTIQETARDDDYPTRMIPEQSRTICLETRNPMITTGMGKIISISACTLTNLDHICKSWKKTNTQIGLLLLFRSLATSYARYQLLDQNQASGISCALLVEWKGHVAEKTGRATAPYDFFEKTCAPRGLVQLH